MSAHNVKMQGFRTETGEDCGLMIFNFDTPEEVHEFKRRVITVWQQMVDEDTTKVMSIMGGEVKADV